MEAERRFKGIKRKVRVAKREKGKDVEKDVKKVRLWRQRKKRTTKKRDSRPAWGSVNDTRGGKNSPRKRGRKRERDASGEAENPVAVFRDRSKVSRSEVSTRVEEKGRWRTSTKPCARSCEWGGVRKVKSARKNLSSAALNSRRVLKQSDGAVSKHFPSKSCRSRGKRKGVERTNGQTYLSLVRQSNHFLREKARPVISRVSIGPV